MEAKWPGGSAPELWRQITQDLGYDARGMLELHSYGQDDRMYDGNAYAIGSTHHSGTNSPKCMVCILLSQQIGSGSSSTTRLKSMGLT